MAHFDQDESNCRKKRKSLTVYFLGAMVYISGANKMSKMTHTSWSDLWCDLLRALTNFLNGLFWEQCMHLLYFFYFQASKWPIKQVAPCGLKKTRF
jgi:hypothetical protein